MDIIYNAIFFMLDQLKSGLGSYALAIIALTALLRIVLWPMNNAQTRSMKKMQELQPKIKELQERHKDNPQKMQEAMMKFYAENKFNPLAGCFPMLIQLPIFIGLYGALISPNFLAVSGGESFFFVDSLAHPLFHHAGKPLDGRFEVKEKDTNYGAENMIEIRFKNGKTAEYKVRDTKKALTLVQIPIVPGEPMTMNLDVRELGEQGFSGDFVKDRIESATLAVVNEASKELERLTFTPKHVAPSDSDPAAPTWVLRSTIDTVPGKDKVDMGVVYLILIYAALTLLYQKVMASSTPSTMEGPQAAMMKLMPLMFVGFLVFLPIPAGVILYLVVTMLLMFVQTAWVKFTDGKEETKAAGKNAPAKQVVDIKPEEAVKK